MSVFDRRPDIRKVKFSGRSINLAMSTRGWDALDRVGIGQKIRALGIPMEKRAVHVVGRPVYYQYYGKEGEAIYSISRGVLNRTMIDLAEAEGAVFYFDQKVWDVDLPKATLYTGDAQNEAWEPHAFDRIFGADGAFSRVRYKMQRRSRFNYSQEFIDSGYKELSIPAGKDGKHRLELHSLHIWPRGNFMLIALPNLDGSFTCTLFMPFEGENSFELLTDDQKVMDFFEQQFPDAVPIMPTLCEDFDRNPLSALVITKCYPWVYWDKVALVGDAAHAVVPFYGQGMNAGFEDIVQLSRLMDFHGDDWETIFEQYQEIRKPNADAISQLSYRNFMEMSSKTADKDFLLRKKIEKRFSEKYPDKWVPLYSRVTFSSEPYAVALKKGEEQARVMDEIMRVPQIEHVWDSEEVEQRIMQLLGTEKSPVSEA